MARGAALTVAGAAIAFAIAMTGVFFARNTAINNPEITVQKQSYYIQDEADAQLNEPNLSVNINTASSAELELLDGIGPVLASRIIEYRSVNGGFIHTEQIMEVAGIGESVYKKIIEHITLN